MHMTEKEFSRESRCQMVMHFIRKMLSEGLITAEEYCQIDTKYREKFLPVTGNLLSGMALFSGPNRANMFVEKGA